MKNEKNRFKNINWCWMSSHGGRFNLMSERLPGSARGRSLCGLRWSSWIFNELIFLQVCRAEAETNLVCLRLCLFLWRYLIHRDMIQPTYLSAVQFYRKPERPGSGRDVLLGHVGSGPTERRKCFPPKSLLLPGDTERMRRVGFTTLLKHKKKQREYFSTQNKIH